MCGVFSRTRTSTSFSPTGFLVSKDKRERQIRFRSFRWVAILASLVGKIPFKLEFTRFPAGVPTIR